MKLDRVRFFDLTFASDSKVLNDVEEKRSKGNFIIDRKWEKRDDRFDLLQIENSLFWNSKYLLKDFVIRLTRREKQIMFIHRIVFFVFSNFFVPTRFHSLNLFDNSSTMMMINRYRWWRTEEENRRCFPVFFSKTKKWTCFSFENFLRINHRQNVDKTIVNDKVIRCNVWLLELISSLVHLVDVDDRDVDCPLSLT